MESLVGRKFDRAERREAVDSMIFARQVGRHRTLQWNAGISRCCETPGTSRLTDVEIAAARVALQSFGSLAQGGAETVMEPRKTGASQFEIWSRTLIGSVRSAWSCPGAVVDSLLCNPKPRY